MVFTLGANNNHSTFVDLLHEEAGQFILVFHCGTVRYRVLSLSGRHTPSLNLNFQNSGWSHLVKKSKRSAVKQCPKDLPITGAIFGPSGERTRNRQEPNTVFLWRPGPANGFVFIIGRKEFSPLVKEILLGRGGIGSI